MILVRRFLLYKKINYERAKNNFNKDLMFDDENFKDEINLYLEKINFVME